MDDYAGAAVDFIVNGLPADALCKKLGLCNNATSVKAGGECPLCEFIVSTLDKGLSSNSTQVRPLLVRYLV